MLIDYTRSKLCIRRTVADPGFPRGGGANHPGWRQHKILPNFPENYMKLKEFGPPGELSGSKCAIFDKQIPRNNTKMNEMNEICTYFQPIGQPPDTNSKYYFSQINTLRDIEN